jgi:transposase
VLALAWNERYAELTPRVTNPDSHQKKLIEEIRRQDAVIIGLHRDLTITHQELSAKNQQLAWAELRVQQLEAKLREERIKRFGPASETLSDLQLELLMEEPSVTADEVQREAEQPPVPEPPKRERKPHGRSPLPRHLRREEVKIACSPDACQCAECGAETVVIGYDESEQLHKIPAQYFVRVTKREKRACRACAQGTVTMAPLPERILDKSLASDELIIDVLVNKYCDHLPLYRQEAILTREAGWELSRSTMTDWMMKIGEMLQPVTAAMRQELLATPYLQADETTVPVQMHDKSGSNGEAYLWQYGQPGGSTVFEFALTRAATEPKRFLKGFAGLLQTDGYAAYDGVGEPGMTHLGCWAHARRQFVDAVKVNKQDAEAIAMVTRMDALFLIDRHARENALSPEARQALRDEQAAEWRHEIHAKCLELAPRLLPESALGKAVKYTLNQWAKLERCLTHPLAELSNNLVENSMRPIAVGRKNWLHVGSRQAGPKVAAILSVVESCRRLGVPVRAYLTEVLPGLEERTLSEVKELTPARWAARKANP